MRPETRALLICPRCRSPLSGSVGGGLRCSEVQCALSHADMLAVDGKPVLVDFDVSILSRDFVLGSGGGTPDVQRHLGLKARLRNFITGENQVAAPNAAIMLSEMRKLSPHPRLLVIGSGERGAGTQAFYEAQDIEIIGIDIYVSKDVDVIADGHAIAMADGCFDGVWVQAVLQHVLDPAQIAAEIHRVLKPDGVVYAETSFMQSVCERGFDFQRFTRSGHRWLFRQFTEIASGNVGGPGQSALWALRYLFRGLFRSEKLATILSLPFFWLRFFDVLIPADFASDAANGVFFLGRRSDVSLSPHDMPGYYPGARLGG